MALEGNNDEINEDREVDNSSVEEPKDDVQEQQKMDDLDNQNSLEREEIEDDVSDYEKEEEDVSDDEEEEEDVSDDEEEEEDVSDDEDEVNDESDDLDDNDVENLEDTDETREESEDMEDDNGKELDDNSVLESEDDEEENLNEDEEETDDEEEETGADEEDLNEEEEETGAEEEDLNEEEEETEADDEENLNEEETEEIEAEEGNLNEEEEETEAEEDLNEEEEETGVDEENLNEEEEETEDENLNEDDKETEKTEDEEEDLNEDDKETEKTEDEEEDLNEDDKETEKTEDEEEDLNEEDEEDEDEEENLNEDDKETEETGADEENLNEDEEETEVDEENLNEEEEETEADDEEDLNEEEEEIGDDEENLNEDDKETEETEADEEDLNEDEEETGDEEENLNEDDKETEETGDDEENLNEDEEETEADDEENLNEEETEKTEDEEEDLNEDDKETEKTQDEKENLNEDDKETEDEETNSDKTALDKMSDYMSEHNYGREDYDTYSKDPEWQRLNDALKKEDGIDSPEESREESLDSRSTLDQSEDGIEPPGHSEDSPETENPERNAVETIDAKEIDMSGARGMDGDHFWDHHGNEKEDYMKLAEKLPEVQKELDSGKSLDELKENPEYKDTVEAYYNPDKMIKVEQKEDGSYEFLDDGRHRVKAAQEAGVQIPVEVVNKPETKHPDKAALSEETRESELDKKSDLETSDETDSVEKDETDSVEKDEADSVEKALDKTEKMNGVREINKSHYSDARELAKNSEVGRDFTDHTEEHVEMVAEKSREAADTLEKAIEEGTLQKTGKSCEEGRVRFEGNIDRDVLEGAALSHDTGMSGGGYSLIHECDENGKPLKDENGKYIYEKDENGNYAIKQEENGDFNEVRENHSLNSAINVLENRDKLKNLGYNDEQIDAMAAECMAHSKSSSGVSDLNSKADWSDCFDRMDAAVEAYNADHPDAKISFDRSTFEENDEKLGQLATSTLALRVGDVSRDSGPEAVSQSGDEVHVDRDTLNDTAGDVSGEIEGADITRGENYEDITSSKSRQVHAGEQNITENHTLPGENGKVTHEITVNDMDSAPACTMEAISDHLGELASAKDGVFDVNIKTDKNCTPDVQEMYEEFRDESAVRYPNVTIHYPWD